ncbi:MAG: AAA family ATPase [Desulfurococcales archaeon]|nr:AAA family ATPase [Desulfurococcales archaeon]
MAEVSEACKAGLVIAVSGLPGSGKTSLAKRLAERLGLRYLSLGEMFRKLAREKKLTLEELSRMAEEDASIDKAIDDKAIEEASKGCIVVDGHISAWTLENTAHLKVLVMAPINVRAERIAKRDGKSIEEALTEIRIREESESRRFMKFYGINIFDLSVFDLIVNSEKFDEEEVFEIVMTAVKAVLEKLSKGRKA